MEWEAEDGEEMIRSWKAKVMESSLEKQKLLN